MPYDDDITSTENPRGDDAAHANDIPSASAANVLFHDIGTRNVRAALRLQTEMFEIFHDVGRDWLERAASEAELAFDLPNKLTAAQTVPEALSAYQEWLNDWMSRVGEDSRRFVADSQKIVDKSVNCLVVAPPAGTT
jgi:hypothetical protein